MFGKELSLIIKSIKKTIFYILKILIKIWIVWERTLIYNKKYKNTIFYIVLILIKIGNVWERILIYHKRDKRDNSLHLENIN